MERDRFEFAVALTRRDLIRFGRMSRTGSAGGAWWPWLLGGAVGFAAGVVAVFAHAARPNDGGFVAMIGFFAYLAGFIACGWTGRRRWLASLGDGSAYAYRAVVDESGVTVTRRGSDWIAQWEVFTGLDANKEAIAPRAWGQPALLIPRKCLASAEEAARLEAFIRRKIGEAARARDR